MRLRILGAAGAALLIAAGTARADEIAVRVNGERIHFLSAQPTQIAGRVMIPLRGVLQQIGAERVEWRPERQEVLVREAAGDMRLRIGDRVAVVNGRPVELDVPPMIIQGTTMVPLRFVSENLGARVDWLPNTQTVYIVTSGERVAGARERLPADRGVSERERVPPRRDRYADEARVRPNREPVPRRDDRLDRDPALRSPHLAALYPRPGAMVNDPRTEISAQFRPGAAVDLETARLSVNGRDVTRDAQVTSEGVRYLPARDLPQGRNNVRLTFRDTRGVLTSQEWDFFTR